MKIDKSLLGVHYFVQIYLYEFCLYEIMYVYL